MLNYTSLHELSRQGLLCGHLILCALAMRTVIREELAKCSVTFTRGGLEALGRSVSRLFVAVWAAVVAFIQIDTNFNPAILQGKAKLLLKLIKLLGVLVLTANGVVFHSVSFPSMSRNMDRITYGALLAIVMLDATHWLASLLIGLTVPLGQVPLDELLAIYLSLVGSAVLFGLFVFPCIRAYLLDGHSRI